MAGVELSGDMTAIVCNPHDGRCGAGSRGGVVMVAAVVVGGCRGGGWLETMRLVMP